MRTLIWAAAAFSAAAVVVSLADREPPKHPVSIAKDRWLDGPAPTEEKVISATPVEAAPSAPPGGFGLRPFPLGPGVPDVGDDPMNGAPALAGGTRPPATAGDDLDAEPDTDAPQRSRTNVGPSVERESSPDGVAQDDQAPNENDDLRRRGRRSRASSAFTAQTRRRSGDRAVSGIDELLRHGTRAADGGGLDPMWRRGAVDRAPAALPAGSGDDVVFRNSYYYFPAEHEGPPETPIYDASCDMIALVPQGFHDNVCVQGSGRLATGETVSFARRDCPCATVCPRTGQRICFDKLDATRFPSGRGATGRAIEPLRTVAVDTSVIPLGQALFIPEYVGLPRPDGSSHDGCFIAADRGLRVTGRHVDVFTGDIQTMRRWNTMVPTHMGVHVRVGDPRCTATRARP